jgi:hypothetical protein
MSAIHFTTTLFAVDSWVILRLPDAASVQLPSRGQVAVKGLVNDIPFEAVLEPDGRWSHFLKLKKALRTAMGVQSGDRVTVVVAPVKEWPEPAIPKDLQVALRTDATATKAWRVLTPMARWEWIRWIKGTKSEETRARRVRVSLSKLRAGEKRPCCFNRAMCTDPSVSRGGVLMIPIPSP